MRGFEADKASKEATLKDLDDRVKELKTKADSLTTFVVTFARTPNQGESGPVMRLCPDPTIGPAHSTPVRAPNRGSSQTP